MSATSLSSSATTCQSFSTSVDSMRILRIFISSGIRYFHTLSFSVSRNPFVCHSYENCRVYINNSHSGTPHTPFANRTSNLCGLTSVFSYSCELFCTRQKLNSLVFKRFRTLCTKHPGWGEVHGTVPPIVKPRMEPRDRSLLATFPVLRSARIQSLPTAILFLFSLFLVGPASFPQTSAPRAHLGFDRNDYPGDAALPILRKPFSFTGYWLSPPPGEKANTWKGKREILRSLGFGFLVLYRGPQISELQQTWSESRFNRSDRLKAQAGKRGTGDARDAAAAAKKEGFPSHTVIFLDIEEGGRLPAVYHVYLRAWVDQLARAGYRAGVYCSGMPVSEGRGATIVTADDIRNNVGSRGLVYWVYNDSCPPSPGCVVPQNPPPPSKSGIPYAQIWQFAQSPRRKEFSARCAATYPADGNCYAPGDTAHSWFLDINSANSTDPSHGK